MSKLKEKVKDYFKKKKTVSIVLDFLFYALILLFIIPGTRKTILPVFMRTILHPPLKKVSSAPLQKITEKDYQWSLNTPDGEQVFLGDFKQQVLFINFWATWCPPCRAEMPGIQKLYEKYGERVKFLMITAEEPGVVKSYLSKNSYTFPVYLQKYKAPAVFRTNSIPATFIVDASGGIVLSHKGASKWNSGKIEHLLDELIAQKEKR